MRSNFELSLQDVLTHEGGYSNDPNDAGGATMHGIIQDEYDAYRRRKGLIPRHVKLIDMDEVREIYRTQYWDKVDGDQLPIGVDYVVFDAAVNSGPARGIQWLQQGINKCAGKTRCEVDKQIGPMTLDASDDYDAYALCDAMLDARLGFMKVARNSKTGAALWPSFGAGWSNRLFGYLPKGASVRRADGVDDQAREMIAAAKLAAPAVPAAISVSATSVKTTSVPTTSVVTRTIEAPSVTPGALPELAVIKKPALPAIPTQPAPQMGWPHWAVVLAAAAASLFGVLQWAH